VLWSPLVEGGDFVTGRAVAANPRDRLRCGCPLRRRVRAGLPTVATSAHASAMWQEMAAFSEEKHLEYGILT
jgi:hypothetical protein